LKQFIAAMILQSRHDAQHILHNILAQYSASIPAMRRMTRQQDREFYRKPLPTQG
jgi:hypothetical protein